MKDRYGAVTTSCFSYSTRSTSFALINYFYRVNSQVRMAPIRFFDWSYSRRIA